METEHTSPEKKRANELFASLLTLRYKEAPLPPSIFAKISLHSLLLKEKHSLGEAKQKAHNG